MIVINQIVELHRAHICLALDRQRIYLRDTHLSHEEGHPDEPYKRGRSFLIKVSSLNYKEKLCQIDYSGSLLQTTTELSIGASPTVSPTVVFVLQVFAQKLTNRLKTFSSPICCYDRKEHQQLAPSVGRELLAMSHSHQNQEDLPSMPTYEIH